LGGVLVAAVFGLGIGPVGGAILPGGSVRSGGEPTHASHGWSIQRTPTPEAGGSILYGVACPSPRVCVAAGSTSKTLVERWHGSRWQVQPTPTPKGNVPPDSEFYGVSCTSGRACTAVGYFDHMGSDFTLAGRWNGSRWSDERSPHQGDLSGVSCASGRACTAVGSFYNSGHTLSTLAERWNGSRWSPQRTPNPESAMVGSSLEGVSCTSVRACTAVGAVQKRDGKSRTLVERWNRSRWSIQRTSRLRLGDSAGLHAVSCPSKTACVAVGNHGPLTLVERWNGARWSVQTSPNPHGATTSRLNGVSCSSVNVCTAVGTFDNTAHKGFTLAERWNGSRWSIQRTPNPKSATVASILLGVSCASARTCVAAGAFFKQLGSFTLAERWTR
jgi:hypothetical protein